MAAVFSDIWISEVDNGAVLFGEYKTKRICLLFFENPSGYNTGRYRSA
jgi:hypothetical protein